MSCAAKEVLIKTVAEVLIKTVAQGIPTYAMSCFILSLKICKKITSAVSNYLLVG
uniref:Uncharacterized protein n=1 Tax=Arundo donax TaxID=35708 RepID=A0A0A9BG94_ARUDO